MSSTNRGGERREADNYPSPAYTVHRFLDVYQWPIGQHGSDALWLEPCAGEGSIITAAQQRGIEVQWDAVELREECRPELETLSLQRVTIDDFLNPTIWTPPPTIHAIVTNPPYSLAQEFVMRALELCDRVCMLLSLNFLCSDVRNDWMRANVPSLYVLPERPAFKGDGKGDSVGFAWFVWDGRRPSVNVLGTTPLATRRLDEAIAQALQEF